MELQHFSHEHPLIISSEKREDESDEKITRVCRGCALSIFSGSTMYTCQECDQFTLHKTCAELPRELKHHHTHPQHALVLHPKSPSYPDACRCNSCYNLVYDNFIYYCAECNFALDVICASSDHPTEINTIQHRSHPQHPLVLLGRPGLLLCDACGEQHRGRFYMCNSCRFYIHHDCASFPSTIKHSDHPAHSLILTYFNPLIPFSLIFSPDLMRNEQPLLFGCQICRKYRPMLYWTYRCNMCLYYIHIKCAMSKTEPFMSILLPRVSCGKSGYSDTQIADRDNDVIRLPPPNEFVSVVGHLTTSTNVVGMREVLVFKKVNHLISHQHPLVFLDAESSSSNVAAKSYPFSPDNNSQSYLPNCDVCFRVVWPPFFYCKTCNLVFHEMCSKLPLGIQHPCHPEHLLILLPNVPRQFFNLFICEVCCKLSNGICFYCPTCEISLDVKCALLPRNIIHEAHPQHVLVGGKVYSTSSQKKCCALFTSRYEYRCNTCDFGLHCYCALYPSTARYKYDEHELKLIYDPSQGNSEEYYCEICEIQIVQSLWFYHCNECDKSIHIWCTPPDDHSSFRSTGFPSIGYYSNLKFGGTLNSELHPHTLTFVLHLDGSSCCTCGNRIQALNGLAFECSGCNFLICFWCCGAHELSRRRRRTRI